jgi:hypothetical protein
MKASKNLIKASAVIILDLINTLVTSMLGVVADPVALAKYRL